MPATRITVLKTHKLYINGAFPRAESGRTYAATGPDGATLANVGLASRKDFREAVKHARAGLAKWSGSSAYLRGQILYRAAEMLEARAAQFIDDLRRQGVTEAEARREVTASVDRLVYYAGWTDKVQQVFSSVNPVASSHFNFSLLEPTGVVAILAPETPSLLGLVSLIAPALAGGNTVVALGSFQQPIATVALGEVLHTSDVPAGAVNLLTGKRSDLLAHFASHMDVNAIVTAGATPDERREIRTTAAANLKRVIFTDPADWHNQAAQSPYAVSETMETKTTWHPVGL